MIGFLPKELARGTVHGDAGNKPEISYELTRGYGLEKTLRPCRDCRKDFMGGTIRNVVCFNCRLGKQSLRNKQKYANKNLKGR